jgi:hypothetical protein
MLGIAERIRDRGRVAGVPDRALHRGEGRGVGVAVVARAVKEADVAVGVDRRDDADVERTLARAAVGVRLAVGALDIDGAAAALADTGQIGRQQLLEGLSLPGRQGRADAWLDEADHAGRHAEPLQREMVKRRYVLRREGGLQRRAVADALITLRQGHRSARREVGRQRNALGIEPQALDIPALGQRKTAVPENEVFVRIVRVGVLLQRRVEELVEVVRRVELDPDGPRLRRGDVVAVRAVEHRQVKGRQALLDGVELIRIRAVSGPRAGAAEFGQRLLPLGPVPGQQRGRILDASEHERDIDASIGGVGDVAGTYAIRRFDVEGRIGDAISGEIQIARVCDLIVTNRHATPPTSLTPDRHLITRSARRKYN